MSKHRDAWGQTLRSYCTHDFIKKHIYEGDEDLAKKYAEIKTNNRNRVELSTIVWLDYQYANQLMMEVRDCWKEKTYDQNLPFYTTKVPYPMYERGWSDKRSRMIGLRKFNYDVHNLEGDYKICHFDGLAD